MAVLITGATGYIGSELAHQLIEEGVPVKALDFGLYNSFPNRWHSDSYVSIHPVDIRDSDALKKVMRGVEQVVHLAAIVGDRACAADATFAHDINVNGTQAVASAARESGVNSFVFASTCSLYGASPDVVDEESVLRPVSLYARSKQRAEELVADALQGDCATTILRFPTLFGVGRSFRHRMDLVVNKMTADAATKGRISVQGGNQWRPLLHVRDVGRAVRAVLGAPADTVGSQVFNVGHELQNYRIMDIAKRVKDVLPMAEIDVCEVRDARDYRVRFDRFSVATGFQPIVSLADGIREVSDGIAAGELDPDDPSHVNHTLLESGGHLNPTPNLQPNLFTERYRLELLD